MEKISNTIVNLSNSILKHFKCPTFHDTIPEIDNVLKGHRKVVVLLYDGLGKHILNEHLNKTSFIRSHYYTTISSTFPPTTVAATNGFLSGKYPIETGWLAWGVYLEKYEATIACFLNERVRDRVEVAPKKEKIMDKICHFDHIAEMISKHNKKVSAVELYRYPCTLDGPRNTIDFAERINDYLKDKDDAFMYCYYDEPDSSMHEFGISCFQARREIEKLTQMTRDIVKHNPDTLFITIADHGQLDVKFLDMLQHKDLVDCFEHETGLEVRTISFYIKKDKLKLFPELFNKYYGNQFKLYTQKEVLKNNLFGIGKPHKLCKKFIGDFVAVAIGDKALFINQTINGHSPHIMIGHHGGRTLNEMEIDVSIYNN